MVAGVTRIGLQSMRMPAPSLALMPRAPALARFALIAVMQFAYVRRRLRVLVPYHHGALSMFWPGDAYYLFKSVLAGPVATVRYRVARPEVAGMSQMCVDSPRIANATSAADWSMITREPVEITARAPPMDAESATLAPAIVMIGDQDVAARITAPDDAHLADITPDGLPVWVIQGAPLAHD